MRTDVVVLGAGAIGLSCAALPAEAGAAVRIVAAEPPGATTSAAATGMGGPVIRWGDDRTVGWELATVAHLTALDATAGVRLATGLAAAPGDPAGPPSLADDSLVRIAEPDELPGGYGFGMWLRVPVVDVPVYLQYLLDRFVAAGGRLHVRRVTDLADAAGDASVLVDCAGLGARTLCGDEDLHAVKGRQVVVADPGPEGFSSTAPGPAEWASWHAHGEHVLLGGVRYARDNDPAPSPVIAEGILARCAGAAAGRGQGAGPSRRTATDPLGCAAGGRATGRSARRALLRARRLGRAAVLGMCAGGGRAQHLRPVRDARGQPGGARSARPVGDPHAGAAVDGGLLEAER